LKEVAPQKVFMVLLSSCILLLLLLQVPSCVKSTTSLFTLPSQSNFVPIDVEEVKTIHGLKHKINYTVVTPSSDMLNSLKDMNIITVPAHEKIAHSSDFDNDLKLFYRALRRLSSNDTLLRILHFGDSQIEGDRVSGKLRQCFQGVFGGCGTGFMPVSEHRVQRLNVTKSVYGWSKYKVFGSKPSGVHNMYGFLGYYHKMDSIKDFSSIQIRKKRKYFKNVNRADKLTILYHGSSKYEGIQVKIGGQNQLFNGEKVAGNVHQQTWLLDSFSNNSLNINCQQDTTIEVYGLSLDCEYGLAVDNIGLRGSSGTEFTKIHEENLRNQVKLMNVGLVIYQFGVNVIPYVVNDYKFYENMVYKQLRLFKRLMPKASILVVGVSDMCQKQEGEFKSFPNISKVILAQKKAALRAGCSFWDLQKVMGGKGSMKNWVNAEPPLGEKDYTHFNRRGANLVGEKLFNALMSDFSSYNSVFP
jgi:hypothetical protein